MHKGDILPKEAFARLAADPQAVLLDVRTGPEWTFVGSPAVDRLLRISWQTFPTMEVNARFAASVSEAGVPKSAPIFCICRSGSRSAQAASALTAAGFSSCFNVAQGFEGDRNPEGHRGTVGGWKAAGLPWVQS